MVTWFSTDKKPEPGERVLLTVGDYFVCEGFMKIDGKWYRYDDIEVDVETIFDEKVTAWSFMPLSQKALEDKTRTEMVFEKLWKKKEHDGK